VGNFPHQQKLFSEKLRGKCRFWRENARKTVMAQKLFYENGNGRF